jgi:hypothetical protein
VIRRENINNTNQIVIFEHRQNSPIVSKENGQKCFPYELSNA